MTIMGEIYRKADMIITYLGPQHPYDDEAIKLILTMYNHYKRNCPHLESLVLSKEVLNENGGAQSFEIDMNTPGSAGLKAILYGPWTKRLWMIPENIVNENTIMLKGKTIISWDAVSVVANLFSLGENTQILPKDVRVCIALNAMRLARLRLIHHEQHDLERIVNRLFSLLYLFRDWHCSDQRDRIYAILSISSDCEQLGIAPDYSTPVEQVFIEATVRHLNLYQDFHFFRSCLQNPNESREHHLPSWIPFLHSKDCSEIAIRGKVESPDTDPSIDLADFKIECNQKILSLKGLIVDTLSTVVELNVSSLDWIFRHAGKDETALRELDNLNQAVAKVRQEYQNPDYANTALAHCFLQDVNFGKNTADFSPEAGILFQLFLIVTKALSLQHHDFEYPNGVVDDDGVVLELESLFEYLQPFLAGIQDSHGRSFAITEKKYLCLVPNWTQPGDVVATFPAQREL
jgi:hypothetical protein